MLCAKICIIDINIYNMQMGFCRKVKKWFDGLDFGFSHLHDYLGLHDYPGLKSTGFTQPILCKLDFRGFRAVPIYGKTNMGHKISKITNDAEAFTNSVDDEDVSNSVYKL